MGIAVTAESFTCPVCGATSFHPKDVEEGYCGRCHDWTADDAPDVTILPPTVAVAGDPRGKDATWVLTPVDTSDGRCSQCAVQHEPGRTPWPTARRRCGSCGLRHFGSAALTSETRACAVCGRVLTKMPEGYVHPFQDQPEDHPCVPVTLDQIEIIGRCDFCNVDFPAWVIPARDFEMPSTDLSTTNAHWSKGDWSACDECAALIRENKWDGLLRRAAALAAGRWGTPVSLMKARLAPLYTRIRKNVTGPVRRMER